MPWTSDNTRAIESTQESNPTWRIFARMLFEDYGWPLKFFRDLLELTAVSEQLISTYLFLHFPKVNMMARLYSPPMALFFGHASSGHQFRKYAHLPDNYRRRDRRSIN